MYCVSCGAKLSDSQKACPLCKTKVYHPDFIPKNDGSYPSGEFISEEFNRNGLLFVITILFALAAILPVIFEIHMSGELEWSGYVLGGVLLSYTVVILPTWFKRANPVIFVPSDFAAAMLYVLYISLATGGKWFLSFAFPVIGVLGLIVTAVVTLIRYVKRGKLYIFGGALIALGAWCTLIDCMLRVTFDLKGLVIWSIYPLISFFTLGMMLIIIAIVKPLKESLHKIFFIG